jgi:hypothetical protein
MKGIIRSFSIFNFTKLILMDETELKEYEKKEIL